MPEFGQPDQIRIIAAVCDALPQDEDCEVFEAWRPEEVAGEYREKCSNRLTSVTVGTLFLFARVTRPYEWRRHECRGVIVARPYSLIQR